jgi:multidrug efflux pump subunit AcrB
LSALERFNGQRCVTITANANPPTAVGDASANLRKIAEESRDRLKLPKSFQVVEE